ncbi:zinc finger homeobox protein 4-like [Pollicipes pollicipes]|uniref:zinc finger homeobox protein 4-like n=1 Tax=Pollicipes pollicipes TaxID=41117 RepID=UPI001884B612|nr:zinc finger homeobox protein 4-like [Pollicipes pollicipes]
MDARSEAESMDFERFSNAGSPASSTASLVPPGPQPLAPQQQQAKPNKRYRTQMSQTQVKIMKQLFSEYKTPTMSECELLGSEIGLAKRVVQVWFQNARAKGKKQQQVQGFEPEPPRPAEECRYCNFKYSHKYAIQDHIFTRKHIENVRAAIENDRKTDGFYQPPASHAPPSAAPAPAPAPAQAPAPAPAPPADPPTPAEKPLPPVNKNMSLLLQQMYGMGAPLPPQLPLVQNQPEGSDGGDGAFGTPLRLLQIPAHALAELRQALQADGPSEARFTQDGCSAAGLRGVAEVDGESGAVCKQCHLVFPTVRQLERHPCCQSGGAPARLLLTQRQYQCLVCLQRLATRAEAVGHIARLHGGGPTAARADVADKIASLAQSKTLAGLGGTDTNGNFHHAAAGAVRGEQ